MMRLASRMDGNMSDAGWSDETVRLGLLMEAAQAQQRLAQESLDRLAAHTRSLDELLRDEVRRTIAEGLGSLTGETRRATESLKRMRRAGNVRTMLWTVSIATICSGVMMIEATWMLPSQREVAALRARRDALAANVARLEQHGGAIDVRACGTRARLCVRVDRNGPAYGSGADYLVVKGH